MAEGVEHGEITPGLALKETGERVVTVVAKGSQQLDAGNDLASAVNGGRVGGPALAEQVRDKLGVLFGALEGGLIVEVILVPAVDPVGEVLDVEAAAGFAEFVDDDASREAVIEHVVDEIAGLFGEAGDFAVAAWILGIGLTGGEVLNEVGGGGHRILDF